MSKTFIVDKNETFRELFTSLRFIFNLMPVSRGKLHLCLSFKLYCKTQRKIQKPVKHLRWSGVLMGGDGAESH